MERRLVRVPGRPVVVEYGLAVSWIERPADPNGYYRILSLAPGRAWTMADVRSAFRRAAKRYHPDGSEPNPERYERAIAAYAVLSDSEARREYDALDGSSKWLDEVVARELVRRLATAPSGVARIDVPGALRAGLLGRGGRGEPPPAPAAPPENHAYYHYEGEEPPPRGVREEWISLVKRELWDQGHRGLEVKLGFSPDDPHVVVRPWGRVAMLPPEPDVGALASVASAW